MTARLVCAAILTASLGVGCSSDAKDSRSDTPKPSQPSDTSSVVGKHGNRSTSDPIGAPPDPPEGAKKNTLGGAEDFVRYYIELLNYASDTGDTRPLKAQSGSSCGGCHDYANLYEQTYRSGGFFEDGDWVPQPQVLKQNFEGTVRLVVTVDAKPGRYKERRTAPTRAYGSNQYSLTFVLSRSNGRWVVREFDGSET